MRPVYMRTFFSSHPSPRPTNTSISCSFLCISGLLALFCLLQRNRMWLLLASEFFADLEQSGVIKARQWVPSCFTTTNLQGCSQLSHKKSGQSLPCSDACGRIVKESCWGILGNMNLSAWQQCRISTPHVQEGTCGTWLQLWLPAILMACSLQLRTWNAKNFRYHMKSDEIYSQYRGDHSNQTC